MRKTLILIIFILTLISCSSDDDSNRSELYIRLSNVSQYDFQNIIVNTKNVETRFANLSPKETTNYKKFATAYSYAFVELEIDGKIYTIQPIDFVGETPLENGNYTYEIDANDSLEQYGKLTMSLIVD